MSKFQINISDLDKNINKYKGIRKNIEKNVNLYCNILSNVDSAWEETGKTDFFKIKIADDKKNVKDYFNYLNSYYSEIEKFKNDISYFLSKYKCPNDATVKYSSENIFECTDYIDSAINNIEVAKYYMLHYRLDGGERNLIYPVPEFTEYTLVNEILNSLSNIYNSLDRYKNNIENLSKGFDDAVYDSKRRKSNLQDFKGHFDKLIYKEVGSTKFNFENEVNFHDSKADENLISILNNSDKKIASTNNYKNIEKPKGVAVSNNSEQEIETLNSLNGIKDVENVIVSNNPEQRIETPTSLNGLNSTESVTVTNNPEQRIETPTSLNGLNNVENVTASDISEQRIETPTSLNRLNSVETVTASDILSQRV